MRTLFSWISVCLISLWAQVLTFILSGLGLGYGFGALQMYKLKKYEAARDIIAADFGAAADIPQMVTGLNDKDWIPLKDAVANYDFAAAVSSMPVLGWYFLMGFLFGGTLSVLIINIATFYHMRRLAQGGQAMAERLGALPLDSSTAPGSLSSLHKIVRALSDDFNLPVPAIHMLAKEDGMNAFVVGRKKDSSVLVVTRGLRHMDEKQLRGIVAHELAHIRNGDMVHNMRLLAVELGINSVRHTAEWMLRRGTTLLFGSSANYRFAMIGLQWGFFLTVLGIFLWPMGLISSLAGSAVMAMTNRRREMRADRLAARILGSWEPIGDALKRIMGHDYRSRIAGPDGRKLGHLMFAQANGKSGGLLDTHPKLQRRIKKADRHWDGIPLYESEAELSQPVAPGNETSVMRSLANLPAETMELFLDHKAALLTVPALLLYHPENREVVSSLAGGKIQGPIHSLWAMIDNASDEEWFALVELTLRHVRDHQDPNVRQTLEQIRVSAPNNAWEVQCLTTIFLDAYAKEPKAVKVKYKNFDNLIPESLEVISIGVSMGSEGLGELRFQRIWGLTGLGPVGLMGIDPFDFDDLEQSMTKLNLVPRTLRQGLAEGFAQGLLDRNRMGATEAVFLKYICHRWNVTTRASITPGNRNPC
ncbi:MAG: M48 family metalloprotease [Pirellulaceae bacterium]